MPLEEEQLNGRIASLIRNQTADLGWHVQEEAKGSFQHDKLKKPDIVIRRIDAHQWSSRTSTHPHEHWKATLPAGSVDGWSQMPADIVAKCQ